MSRESKEVERIRIAHGKVAADMYKALLLAEIWLVNSIPIGEFMHKEPKPLPVIRKAMATARGEGK